MWHAAELERVHLQRAVAHFAPSAGAEEATQLARSSRLRWAGWSWK